MVNFRRFTKTLHNRETHIKKRSFNPFQPDNFRANVAEMPEVGAVLQCRDVDTAATLLTAGLTRLLDEIKTLRSRQDCAPYIEHLQGRRNRSLVSLFSFLFENFTMYS